MNELASIVSYLSGNGDASPVLATLVAASGSSYRRPGARLLVTAEGNRIGSISGGCLEEDIVVRARRVAATGCAELITYDTSLENDLVWGVGLGCHGVVQILLEKIPPSPNWVRILTVQLKAREATELAVVWRSADSALLGTHLANELSAQVGAATVFFEAIHPPVSLVIFGAGDDAQPLVRLARELGWHVTMADPRPEFVTMERFPGADALLVAPASELVGRVFGARENASTVPDGVAVVMTHHYVHDVPLLRDLLHLPLRYVGLLGPKQRGEKILADLVQDGVEITPEQLKRLHAPVGLDLGAESPTEVALSIVAEICATLAGRDARPLRERNRPIHE